MIRVVLADDQALVRAGFRALLDAEDDLTVVGEAANGDEAVSLCRELRPDVVLMDIRMPGSDGLAATRTITADDRLAAVRIVILTTFELDEYVFEALRAGASGFLVKDTEPAELRDDVPREPSAPVDLRRNRMDAALGEVAHRVAQLALGIGQFDPHATGPSRRAPASRGRRSAPRYDPRWRTSARTPRSRSDSPRPAPPH